MMDTTTTISSSEKPELRSELLPRPIPRGLPVFVCVLIVSFSFLSFSVTGPHRSQKRPNTFDSAHRYRAPLLSRLLMTMGDAVGQRQSTKVVSVLSFGK